MDIGLHILHHLNVLLLFQVLFVIPSLLFLLGLSNLVKTCLDNSIDLTSDVTLPLIVFFEMTEDVGLLFSMVLEKSDHLLGILLGQHGTIGQVIDDLAVLGDIMDHIESHIIQVNPFDGIEAQPFTDLTPIGELFVLLIQSSHLGDSQKVVLSQTCEDEKDVSFSS